MGRSASHVMDATGNVDAATRSRLVFFFFFLPHFFLINCTDIQGVGVQLAVARTEAEAPAPAPAPTPVTVWIGTPWHQHTCLQRHRLWKIAGHNICLWRRKKRGGLGQTTPACRRSVLSTSCCGGVSLLT